MYTVYAGLLLLFDLPQFNAGSAFFHQNDNNIIAK